MKRLSVFALLIVFTLSVYSQRCFDYKRYKREKYGLSCSNITPANVDSSFTNLIKMDTNTIGNGLDEYFHDLGMAATFYGVYHKEKRKEYAYMAIKCFIRSIQLNPSDPGNYYEIIFVCMSLNDYKTAKDFVEPYEKLTPIENREKYITDWLNKSTDEYFKSPPKKTE